MNPKVADVCTVRQAARRLPAMLTMLLSVFCPLSNAAEAFEGAVVCYLSLPGLPLLQWQTTQ